ncbi:MAG TPA: hypothetical protein VFT59_02855 [Candidatus Saccharimonadales bacterium]|nr:hypothetical protein [Candidatus Saccharimonadales bacterium]
MTENPMEYLSMPLSELVEISIDKLKQRIARAADKGVQASAEALLGELQAWQMGHATVDDKDIHQLCFVVVGVLKPDAMT